MRDLYQEVTDRIVAELEAGVPPLAAVDYLRELALREPAQAAE
jgi:antirestriction protein ArdC